MKRLLLILIAVWLCGVVSAQSIFRLQYWFDGQHDNMVTALSSNGKWQTPIETNQLPNGFHTLYIQVQDSTEQWFSPRSFFFYRVPDTMTNQGVRYTYWFDNDSEHLFSDSISTGHLLLDASMLTDGFHTVNFQFIFSNSVSFKSYLFYKTPSFPNATDSIEYVFWFDQDFDHRQSGFCLQEHLVFDIDSLSAGFHTLNAQFIDGNNSTFKSFQFYKRPRPDKIVKYEYWLNDLDSLKQSFTISPQDTVDFVSLISMPALPIRSSYFHYNPNDGNPIINAKNDIHFRFYNETGRFANKTKTYVDITVVDTVYADTIERNTTKIVAAPTNNAIHWFKLAAGVGDSLSFRTNKLCTMQLYAPSGEMVFHASNDSVLTWNGCHAWDQGDYYLAVHDAADTGTISVSYQWIYRYAVLAWDVHRVGNGGISTITFEGNGFSSLDTMFLVRGTDTIPTLYINRENNTKVSIYFNFEGIDTGMFNGAFVYVDEGLYMTEVVYVEEAKPIVLTTTCSYPSTFLHASTVTFTYTITNKGNMSAYNAPLYIYIGTPTERGITHIKIEGLGLKSIIAELDMDSIPTDEIEELIAFAEEIGDDHYFLKFHTTDEDSGDSVFIRSNYFFISLHPYETKTIEIQIEAIDTVEVWLKTTDSIPPYVVRPFNNIRSHIEAKSSKGGYEDFCCSIDKISCVVSVISLFASAAQDLVPPFTQIFSCLANIASSTVSIMNNSCDGDSNAWTEFSNMNSIFGIVLNCAQGVVPGTGIFKIIKYLHAIMNGTNLVMDCKDSFTQKNPGCPPCPPDKTCGPGGGKSFPRTSADPNDITGYIAESGSLAVGAEQMQLPYMIEFENDTTFATANAHTVVVKDTLDGNVFDLKSMSATSFSIGDHVETVNGGHSFVRTVDMRPAIDIIAQVQLDYHIDTNFAVATWTFSSLDPLTLLPTTDPTLGILPPNFNGDGVGEVNFTINRKANLPDSTLIRNRTTIIFDHEDPIPTSTWVNVIDNIPPTSAIDSIVYDGGMATLSMHATDNLSGVWRYNVYGQVAEVIWQPVAMQIPADTVAVFETMADQYVAFRTTAIDSAGNVEPLAPTPTTPTVYDSLFITACESYVWFDSLYTASGEYVHTKVSTIPIIADSVTTLYLTINHGTYNAETVTVCDNYEWYGETYTTSGTYTYEYTNADDCPSVDTLYLTINYSTTSIDEQTACESFTWIDSVTYTESTNEPIFTLMNEAGCDSVITLHLTINNPVHIAVTETACESFTWNGTTYTVSGDYTFSHADANGCTQVDTLHLTINNPVHIAVTETACESFTWNGTTYTVSGDYTFSHADANGCTQVDTLHLTINNPVHIAVTETACESFTWNGTTYTVSGDYTFSHADANGCTQVDTLHLIIFDDRSSEFSISCPDSCYTWNTQIYCASGDYTQTLQTVHGCDSVVTLHLTITVGVEDYDGFTFKVYPNPTSNIVNVQCTMNNVQFGNTELHLCDAYGRLLDVVRANDDSPSRAAQIDLSRYANGIYFVKAVADGKTIAVRKVVKQ